MASIMYLHQEWLFLLIVWVAGWPGLALAHGCCWFPAATGFGFSVELGMIQGVSAVGAFYELMSQSSLNVSQHGERKQVALVELCPILKTLYKILIKREQSSEDILQALRDENMNDPRDRIEIAQSHAFYMPPLR